jgi:hypothetical protein
MKAWDMDATRFDSLIRTLRDVRSRRGALATLLSGTLAAVGVTAVADAKGKGDRKVMTQGSGGQRHGRKCLPLGRVCWRKTKKGSARETRACTKCCASVTILTGKKGRCCNHEGRPCATTEQCCLGVCTNGTCQAEVILLPPCVATGQLCPAGCDSSGSCDGCCTGECNSSGACGMIVEPVEPGEGGH